MNLGSLRVRTRATAVGVVPLNHHAIIYRHNVNSRLDFLIPAQSRTSLGFISLSSHHTKQFSLPHHAPTFSRIHPPDGLGRYSWYNCPLSQPISSHPMEVSGHQVTALNAQASNSSLPMNPALTDLHTGIRRHSSPMLHSPPTHTSSTFPAPSISLVLRKSS